MKLQNETVFLNNMRKLLARVICEEENNILLTMESDIVTGVGNSSYSLSSIDYVDFLVAIENEYDIIFDFETKIHTIKNIYDYIIANQ